MATHSTTETKYGVSDRWRWRNETPVEKPRITNHLLENWDRRTPAWSCSPEYAYDHSVKAKYLDLAVFETEKYGQPEMAHYFVEWYVDTEGQVMNEYYEVFLLEVHDELRETGMALSTVYKRNFISKHCGVRGYCDGLLQYFKEHYRQ